MTRRCVRGGVSKWPSSCCISATKTNRHCHEWAPVAPWSQHPMLPYTPNAGIGIEQSFGLAIVTFTLGVKTLLVPLQAIQLQSSEKMQVLQPTVKEINAKFGQNKEAATAATNRLYAETKVNPLIGCLPALLQVRAQRGRRIRGPPASRFFGHDLLCSRALFQGHGVGWGAVFGSLLLYQMRFSCIICVFLFRVFIFFMYEKTRI